MEMPWARTGVGFTLLFGELLLAFVESIPVAAVARIVDETDTRLWRIIHYHVD